ncbi:hypothetical protein B0H63DRAFT_163689 [Podospora didyma]|uniref:Glutamyl-tRNA amidotransferase complex subunit Gta3 domain-containing protein n=1 Tax=Podospora didyma TaxID=330526 RepID=A0AAE0U1S5_9PEZI|nr:hypothetical protein B0H63DRAFT_163689 [Podospora didyma]
MLKTRTISNCRRIGISTTISHPRFSSSSTSSAIPRPQPSEAIDPAALLSNPTWSVRSLLPQPSDPATSSTPPPPTITSSQLHHLLRLSALPLPKSPAAESHMLSVLQSQLSFLQAIQSVDTEGVEPLRSIRDETAAGMAEATIGLNQAQVRAALASEEIMGRCQRPRRQRGAAVDASEAEEWDVLGTASQRAGRYFVVRSGKSGDKDGEIVG